MGDIKEEYEIEGQKNPKEKAQENKCSLCLGTRIARHKANGSSYHFWHLLSHPMESFLYHQQEQGVGQPAQSETWTALGGEIGSKESIPMNPITSWNKQVKANNPGKYRREVYIGKIPYTLEVC